VKAGLFLLFGAIFAIVDRIFREKILFNAEWPNFFFTTNLTVFIYLTSAVTGLAMVVYGLLNNKDGD
jgi:Trk-type K+ transport system membrane component